MTQKELDFSGRTYVAELDGARISGQRKRVLDLMQDGLWRTLGEISLATGDPQASVSARLRDFRKERFGALNVERRRRGEPMCGLWEYRIAIATERQTML